MADEQKQQPGTWMKKANFDTLMRTISGIALAYIATMGVPQKPPEKPVVPVVETVTLPPPTPIVPPKPAVDLTPINDRLDAQDRKLDDIAEMIEELHAKKK